jgi:hypothetical protein
MRRRDFLKVSAVGAGAAAGLTLLGLTRKSAQAAPFGEFPKAVRSLMIPEANRARRVLEIFLYGGLSPWESLYYVDTYGTPSDPTYPNTQFYTFGTTGGNSPQAAMAACSFPAGTPLGQDFGTDELGANVKLGPFALALRQRADLVSRTRILVQRHDLEPHEAAIPFALTGKPLGTPSMAGLGAHIQRYHTDRPEPGRNTPYSYVFSTGSFFAASDNILAAVTTGNHPGRARPLRIRVDAGERLNELLARGSLGGASERDQYDQILQMYANQYRDRLRWNGAGDPARAPKFSDVENGITAVSNADAVAGVLDPSYFVPQPDSMCGDGNSINIPKMSLQLATHLLTHPTQAARYCCVVDTGIIEVPAGGGYDTHDDNSHDQARSFKNLLVNLSALVNQPGEGDPAKLDLDDTLIILNTEFGRTPWAQGSGGGRNHHPYGYVTALIGGPITEDKKAIVGAIGPDGNAASFMTPGENRIAALLAQGIFPFSPEAFGVSDVQGAIDEGSGVEIVTSRALGYTL